MRSISRRRFIAVTAAGAAAAYIGAACSDDDSDSLDTTPGAANTAAPTSAATVDAGADTGAVGLRWYGQSMFVLTSPGGTTILLDPFNDIGYTVPPPLNTDAATITHEHPDHNNAALGGTATLLRGLTADGWADVDQTVGDVRIRTVQSFHDDQQGTQRGRNAIFVFESAGLNFAHLGDLGHQLDAAQLAAVGPIDVLMAPVGGVFTIDAAGAAAVVEALNPKMVFPMHYKTDATSTPLATVDEFLQGKTVERVGSTDIRIARDSLPAAQTTFVLDYA
jgi:L-ascorbate metabolism protein UlaG (beta-lactamase superfamily)